MAATAISTRFALGGACRPATAAAPCRGASTSGAAFSPSRPHPRPRRAAPPPPAAAAAAAAAASSSPAPADNGASAGAPAPRGLTGWLAAQRARTADARRRLGALGLAAVLAYGLFDGVSYTIAFAIAFLGYEARTGLNPTANVADLVKICVLMWAGNNVTRPFRLAGAAALAPAMDRLMDSLTARLRLPGKAAAFALVVAAVAGACLSVVGALFVSRWVA